MRYRVEDEGGDSWRVVFNSGYHTFTGTGRDQNPVCGGQRIMRNWDTDFGEERLRGAKAGAVVTLPGSKGRTWR